MINMCEKALERIRRSRRPSPETEAALEAARRDLNAIIDVTPDATPEDVQKCVEIIRQLKNEKEDDLGFK